MTKSFLSVCRTPTWTRRWHRLGEGFAVIPKYIGIFLVLAYRSVGAVHMGGACRFEPSCSCYAQEALSRLPLFSALRLISVRLLKCRPGGSFGWDPVPQSSESTQLEKRECSHE